MAFSLNRISLLGNLGKDPETRFTTSNVAVTSFSVATSHSYKGKDGNWVNDTTWHNIVAFNLSDFLRDNLKKGKKVYVEGRLTNRSYEDKQGITRYVTEVVADNSSLIVLDAASGGGGGSYQNNNTPFESSQPNQNQGPANMPVEENDDLPF